MLIDDSSLAEGEKSTTQKLSDATGSGTNDAEKQGKTYLESAQETVGDLSKQASDTISGKKSLLDIVYSSLAAARTQLTLLFRIGLADNISGSAKK